MSKKNKFISCILLHALGDTIGFKNGLWEFNYNKSVDINDSNELLYEFIELGGINNINLKNWHISDDTILNNDITESLIEYEENNYNDEKYYLLIKKKFKKSINSMLEDKINRFPGNTTVKYVNLFTNKNDGRTLPYDINTGGNGCAMRCLSIGLLFHQDKISLIDISIQTSRLKHYCT